MDLRSLALEIEEKVTLVDTGEVPVLAEDFENKSTRSDDDTISQIGGVAVEYSMEFDGLSEIDDIDEGYISRTRDMKASYKGSFASTKSGKKSRGDGPIKLFTRRTAQILDVSEREVPEILVNSPKKALRVNGLRFEKGVDGATQAILVDDTLRSEGIEAWRLDWFDGAFIFDAADTAKVQKQTLAEQGKIFIQNPSSYLPVIALEPTHSRNILDMCSAPGGKTALIAALTAESNVNLIANEPKGRRMQKLKEVLGILGVQDVEFMDHDGRHLPNLLGRETFDRILVDAECSTEAGINFESKEPLKDWNIDRVKRVSILQKQLITAAYDLLEPGGVLVYSTCTLSPEENEGVVSTLLERRSDAVVQPVSFEAEETIRKIKIWQGERYPKEVYDRCLRIFPSDYMEGFFLSRIRKPTGIKEIDESFEDVISIERSAQLK